MTLTETDKQRLAQLLEKNRGLADDGEGEGKGRGGYTPRSVATPTDETVALVRKGEWSNDVKYHAYADGEPACGISTKGEFRTMDIDEVALWRSPCSYCYPEGSEHGHEDGDAKKEEN